MNYFKHSVFVKSKYQYESQMFFKNMKLLGNKPTWESENHSFFLGFILIYWPMFKYILDSKKCFKTIFLSVRVDKKNYTSQLDFYQNNALKMLWENKAISSSICNKLIVLVWIS